MPTETIPLLQIQNRRNWNGASFASKDARTIGFIPTVHVDSLQKKIVPYLEKRPSCDPSAILDVGNRGINYKDMSFFFGSTRTCSLFQGSTGTRVFLDNITFCGETDSGDVLHSIQTASLNSTQYVLLSGQFGGYYINADALTSNPTFTGDTTNGSPIVVNVSSTTGLVVGQKLSGTGISTSPARVLSIDSATQITMTKNASATNAGVTITRERMSKIIDADFPGTQGDGGSIGLFAVLDGFTFIATRGDSRIYNSDLNNPSAWTAGNYLTSNSSPDNLITVASYKNYLLAFSRESIEFYVNGGNPFGSPLVRVPELTTRVGMTQAWDIYGPPLGYVGDTIAWVGADYCVYIMDGNLPRKISDDSVQRVLFAAGRNIWLDGFTVMGKKMLHLTQATTGTPAFDYFYDFDSERWVETGLTSAVRTSCLDTTSGAGVQLVKGVSLGQTSGSIYQFGFDSPTFWQDFIGTGANTSTIQTQSFYLNKGRPFRIKWIDLIADTQSSGSTALSTSKDDFATFDSIGSFDLTSNRKRIYRGGFYKSNVAFKLVDSGSNASRVQALDVEWEPCQ